MAPEISVVVLTAPTARAPSGNKRGAGAIMARPLTCAGRTDADARALPLAAPTIPAASTDATAVPVQRRASPRGNESRDLERPAEAADRLVEAPEGAEREAEPVTEQFHEAEGAHLQQRLGCGTEV